MAKTHVRERSGLPLFVLALAMLLQPGSRAWGQSFRDTIRYEGTVVCLDVGGKVFAWDATSGEPDADLAAGLSGASIARIGSNGRRIWGVRRQELLEWSPAARTWNEVARFEPKVADLAAIAVVGNTPLLIFPRKVLGPTDGRTFDVPRLIGEFGARTALQVLAVQPTDRDLWIGTGYGEWGGHLIRLDVRSGRWSQ